MANKFTNFLGGVANASGNLKSYKHASTLYNTNNFELSPKAGWLYFIEFTINPELLTGSRINAEWIAKYKHHIVGILAKSADMPRFTIKTEMVNQYNRKTYVQTGITYNPVRITLHDDMANVTTELWRNYYDYYYADNRHSGKGGPNSPNVNSPMAFSDNKFNTVETGVYRYGLNNAQTVPFFKTITMYLLNRQKYSSITLVNPLISAWDHGKVDQSSSELLESSMTVNYESVLYDTANNPASMVPFNDPRFYDKTSSPLSIGGVGTKSVLGRGGLLAGATDVFGDIGKADSGTSAWSLINTGLKVNNLYKNAMSMNKAGLVAEGMGLVNSTLADIQSTKNITQSIKTLGSTLSNTGVDFFNAAKTAGTNITNAVQKRLDPPPGG